MVCFILTLSLVQAKQNHPCFGCFKWRKKALTLETEALERISAAKWKMRAQTQHAGALLLGKSCGSLFL